MNDEYGPNFLTTNTHIGWIERVKKFQVAQ